MQKSIITSSQANELYKTLKFIHDSLTKHKVRYFMGWGTLLGAIRNQGIIPWDDDGDLCIFKEDVPKLRKLIPYFDKHGYDLEEGTEPEDDEDEKECVRKKDSCTWFVSCRKNNCLGVDIFVMNTKGNKVEFYDPYWLDSDEGRRCFYEKELLFPLLPYRFGNFYMMGPHNAIEHLNRCYGPSWVEKGQVQFNHRTGKWVNSKPRKLSVNEFQTFKAPASTCDSKVPALVCHSSQNTYFSKDLGSGKKTSKKTVRRSPKRSKKRSVKKNTKKSRKPRK